MARLRQILKTGGGQLAETSSEELSKLMGRPAPATSPMETGVIGGNADQAKMAGTGQQKTSALRAAIRGEQDLATTQRRQQVRRTATGKEEKALSGAERLEGLGSLDSRVQELAMAALQKGAGQEQDIELGIDAEGEAAELLTRIRENPEDLAAIQQFNNLMGRTSPSEMFTSEEILTNFDITRDEQGNLKLGSKASGAIGEALAGSVQDKIASGDLNFQQMGFQDINEVAALLGTTPDQLGNMSIPELTAQLDQQIAAEYNTVNNLQAQLNDPALGAAERAEARQALREMGAVGIRSAESDVEELADEIAQANTIDFMGEEMTVEELLDDDFVSGLVQQYFTQPDFKDKLKESHPDLVKFIEKHENVLLESAKEIDASVGEFAALQQGNLDLAKTDFGPDIPNEIMEMWYPGFGKTSTQAMEANGAIQYLKDETIPTANKQHTYSQLNIIKDTLGADSEMMEYLGTVPSSFFNRPEFNDSSSKAYQNFSNHLGLIKFAKDINLDNPDPGAIAKQLGFTDMGELRREIREAKRRDGSGFFTKNNHLAILEKIFTGSNRDIVTKFKEHFLPGGKIKGFNEILQDSRNSPLSVSFDSIKEMNSADAGLYNKVAPYITDGSLDTDDISKLTKDASFEDLTEMFNSFTLRSKAPENFPQEIRKVVWKKIRDEATIITANLGKELNYTFDNYIGRLEQFAEDKPPLIKREIESFIRKERDYYKKTTTKEVTQPEPAAGTLAIQPQEDLTEDQIRKGKAAKPKTETTDINEDSNAGFFQQMRQE